MFKILKIIVLGFFLTNPGTGDLKCKYRKQRAPCVQKRIGKELKINIYILSYKFWESANGKPELILPHSLIYLSKGLNSKD